MKQIGYSLSLCVADICRGKVKIEDVALVVASTKMDSIDAFDEVMSLYAQTYWRNFPMMAIGVVHQLMLDHKFHQPRLWNPNYYQCIARGHWLPLRGTE